MIILLLNELGVFVAASNKTAEIRCRSTVSSIQPGSNQVLILIFFFWTGWLFNSGFIKTIPLATVFIPKSCLQGNQSATALQLKRVLV